jgi:hypothetical protein
MSMLELAARVGLLEELAVRCEIVSGPDRVLDGEICLALGLAGGNVRVDQRIGWVIGGDTPFPVKPLEYTASVDAAATIVPEGWNWMAGNRDQPLARAYVNNGELAFEGAAARRNPKREWYEVTAPTPARALTAAALRARHALALSKGSEG